jgi:hypothetical protein
MNIQDQITGVYVTPLIAAEEALVKANERREYISYTNSQLNLISRKIKFSVNNDGLKNIQWLIRPDTQESLLKAVSELVKAGYLILDSSYKLIDVTNPSWIQGRNEIVISWELDRKEEED